MLKIHHFRNATLVIETEKDVILVDPMLGKKESWSPLAFFRFKTQKNPIVPLPKVCHETLKKVTHCLITHTHPDHLDKRGERFLKDNNIPVTCSIRDKKALLKKGLHISNSLDYWKPDDFLGGIIEGIPAKHGYGFISKPMGNVMGFYIKLPNQKSVYISADTIYTNAVDKVLKEYKPEISIVACGTAQLDLFKPLLMKMDDILKFVKNSPEKVIANHLEAINHCPTTRIQLKKELEVNNLIEKVKIPIDGEIFEI
ncbi:MAG: MBL fold metallo-hydrolase [Bacteroidales bacterium]|nr:MBL fold metallo-hydrolase [Bacteroidales bacterium]MBN2820498.1 MBL fold metallo-hydrolase [Bacteroidales bacterium]